MLTHLVAVDGPAPLDYALNVMPRDSLNQAFPFAPNRIQ